MSKVSVVVIDPGHGGDDNGASYGYEDEDDIALSISYLLRCELEKEKILTFLTRERDVFISLQDRCLFANNLPADLFVSIHCDAWHQETVSGISTHVYREGSKASFAFAEAIQNSLLSVFPNHLNRGVKKAGFYVLKNTNMPAVLIECEFISNPESRKFLREPENQLALARAIKAGIIKGGAA